MSQSQTLKEGGGGRRGGRLFQRGELCNKNLMLSKPARQVAILIAAYSIPISLEAQKQCFIILNLLFVHLYIYEHLLHSTYLWTNYIFEHLLHTYVHLYIMNIYYIHIIYSQQKTRNEHEKSKLNEILRFFGVSTNFSTF